VRDEGTVAANVLRLGAAGQAKKAVARIPQTALAEQPKGFQNYRLEMSKGLIQRELWEFLINWLGD
jgi:hypothetical protein